MSSTVALSALVSACVDLGSRAGKIISTIFEKGDLQVIDKAYDDRKLEHKEDILSASDPQTLADLMAQRLIIGTLQHTFPGLDVRGEEDVETTESDIVSPSLDQNIRIPDDFQEIPVEDLIVWVDPVDGTKEFTEGIKEAVTCLIGIACRGRPIAGVINRPFTGQTVYAVVGGDGVFGYEEGYLERLDANRDKTRRVIATTRSHFRPDMMEYVSACRPTNFVRAGGCGGKGLMVLEGLADAYVFPSRGTKRWDTCAVEAILVAAGGSLTEPDGSLIDYSSNIDSPQNSNGLIATVFGEEYHQSFLRQNLRFRTYDVVFFGATGFTGKFGVEYLGDYYTGKSNQDDLKFAIAGRSKAKLEAVLAERVQDELANELDIIVCDSSDPESVDEMVRSTNVVVTTVGPYRKYGSNLIASCAKHGVDYVDLTGELDWVVGMREKCEQDAQQTGARIVTSAGFVAFPMESSLFSTVKFLKQECGWNPQMGLNVVDINAVDGSGGASGGTLASYVESIGQPNVKRMLRDPTFFVSEGEQNGCPLRQLQPTGPKSLSVDGTSFWGFKSLYADTYRLILNRTNELLGMPYGDATSRFTFESYQKAPNIVIACIVSFVQYLIPLVFMPLLGVSFIREFVRARLPQPGQHSSSEKTLKEAVWDIQLMARTPDGRIGAKSKLKLFGDAGYVNTSKMMLESGITLALQRKGRLDEELPYSGGGFLTVGSALGDVACRRLSRFPFWDFKVEKM